MKGYNDGVKNEKAIVDALNEKTLQSVSDCLKGFVQQIDNTVGEDTVLTAQKIGGQGFKPDVQIKIGESLVNVSVKKGSGNSVHQERTEYFIHYCMKYLDMTEEEKEGLLKYLYGDGTIDGDSQPEERLSDSLLIETYKKEIDIVQAFLDRNKRHLIERFLIYGRLGRERDVKAEYLYHGDAVDGVWCPLDYSAIDYMIELPKSKDAPLTIGPLTLQVWNRNLEAKPEYESRRHSIQIKWGSCKTHIQEINRRCLAYSSMHKNDERIKGSNKQGFDNQNKLIELMDGKRISELPLAVKNIVLGMFPTAALSEKVIALKLNTIDTKPRIAVIVNGEQKNLSVFMGSGNAVHQETIRNFIGFCETELDMNDSEKIALLKILYGDGTTNGESAATDRLKNTSEVKRAYPTAIATAQNFFDKHKKTLVERFLVYGKAGKEKDIKADYIYYGTEATGKILPYPIVVEHVIKQPGASSALLSVGSLTSQPWNRNPEGKRNLESRRHSIQIKWGGMKSDIEAISAEINDGNFGTADGNWEEYELVSKLNREKKIDGSLWAPLCEGLHIIDIDRIYAIRVTNTVYSNLTDRKVLPKSDVYLVRGDIPHQTLLDNNYWLDEDAVKDLDVHYISKSGISCKRADSKNFTYAKLGITSFIKLFGDKELGAAISLFVKEDELLNNYNVLDAWGTNEVTIISYFNDDLESAGLSHSANISSAAMCKVLKKAAISRVEEKIKQDKSVSGAIFRGEGVFEEPYVANYVYINGALKLAEIPPFTITTGSGRHKGIYTIVIKP